MAVIRSNQGMIAEALDAVEAEERVAILFAVESGSRAWGFPSPDSDWDVRFVDARPTVWHIALAPGRDVLERALPHDLDLAGWDARKALNLFLGGNAVLREWLRSPIVYRAEPTLFAAFRALTEAHPARAAAQHHYRSLGRGIVAKYLRGDSVNLKKYLYALRPALTLRWLRENPSGEPPMDFSALLAGVSLDASTRTELAELLARKAAAAEIGQGPRLALLDALVEAELAAEPPRATPPTEAAQADALALFRRATAHADQVLA